MTRGEQYGPVAMGLAVLFGGLLGITAVLLSPWTLPTLPDVPPAAALPIAVDPEKLQEAVTDTLRCVDVFRETNARLTVIQQELAQIQQLLTPPPTQEGAH